MGVYKEGKTGKYRSITKTGREIGKENRKEDSGPKVKLGNGKEISYNSRARVWILNLEIFGDLLQRYGCPSQRKHYVHEAVYY